MSDKKVLIEIYIDENEKMQISWFRITRHAVHKLLRKFADNQLIHNYVKDKEEEEKNKKHIEVIKCDQAQAKKFQKGIVK